MVLIVLLLKEMTNNTLREFKRHQKWANIKPIRRLAIQTLRKCCVQNWANLLPQNVSKELAGHANIETTMTFYTKVDEDLRAKAAAARDSLVSSSNKQKEKL